MPPAPIHDAAAVLDRQFLDMRGKLLAVAADFDRIQRATGGDDVLKNDPRIDNLRAAAALLSGEAPDRAAAMQMRFSDRSDAPTDSEAGK